MDSLVQVLGPGIETPLRLLIAVIAGGCLGWERERQRKPAGLRTHMMVSLGAASVTLSVFHLMILGGGEEQTTRMDPIRVIEGVVGGIGFLGAGTIIRSRGSVEGITTAASIWVAGAVGLACGVGSYYVTFVTVVFALLILWAVGILEQRWIDQA